MHIRFLFGDFGSAKISVSAPENQVSAQRVLHKTFAGKTAIRAWVAKDFVGHWGWSGGFRGASVEFSANGKYVLRYSTDVVGQKFKPNVGKYFFHSNALALVPDAVKGDKRMAQRAISFYVVRWGRRVYLVGRENVKMFCDDIRAGYEPRTPQKFVSSYFLREGDDAKSVSAWPTLPPQFQHLLPTQKFDSYQEWQQNKPRRHTVKIVRGLSKRVGKVSLSEPKLASKH